MSSQWAQQSGTHIYLPLYVVIWGTCSHFLKEIVMSNRTDEKKNTIEFVLSSLIWGPGMTMF